MTTYLGEIRMFACGFAPRGWLPCDGRDIPAEGAYLPLADHLRRNWLFGSDKSKAKLPDLRGRVVIGTGESASGFGAAGAVGGSREVTLDVGHLPWHRHVVPCTNLPADQTEPAQSRVLAKSDLMNPYATSTDQAMPLGNGGASAAHPNMQPTVSITFIINYLGAAADDEFMGEIRLAAVSGVNSIFTIVTTIRKGVKTEETSLDGPNVWHLCDGTLFAINNNTAFHSLLGTTFGGNGRVDFAIPDLRGQTVQHTPQGRPVGEREGAATHSLKPNEIAHTHLLSFNQSGSASIDAPSGNYLAAMQGEFFAATSDITDVPVAKEHHNMMPYIALNYFIRVYGRCPGRN